MNISTIYKEYQQNKGMFEAVKLSISNGTHTVDKFVPRALLESIEFVGLQSSVQENYSDGMVVQLLLMYDYKEYEYLIDIILSQLIFDQVQSEPLKIMGYDDKIVIYRFIDMYVGKQNTSMMNFIDQFKKTIANFDEIYGLIKSLVTKDYPSISREAGACLSILTYGFGKIYYYAPNGTPNRGSVGYSWFDFKTDLDKSGRKFTMEQCQHFAVKFEFKWNNFDYEIRTIDTNRLETDLLYLILRHKVPDLLKVFPLKEHGEDTPFLLEKLGASAELVKVLTEGVFNVIKV